MRTFTDLQNDYYHRISVSPFEAKPSEFVYSDTVLHLPVLEFYASLCKHVTEFGFRWGESTVAFLSGCGEGGEVHSYDIAVSKEVDWFKSYQLPCKWFFHHCSTIDPKTEVAETDMIYFDTEHTYKHLKKELELHGRKAKKFIGFHDTTTCAQLDVSGHVDQQGILKAIHEYVAANPQWKLQYQTAWSNGLMIFGRS